MTDEPLEPLPSESAAPSYRILKKLASGGMGEIYLARLKREGGFEKELVIKKLLPIYAQNQSFVRMFLNEARLASKLSHSNIIHIFDLGKLDDSYFIAMEYLQGENLSDLLDEVRTRGGSIPPSAVLEILCQLLRGLDYAHRKTDTNGQPLKIVHRDISPKNLLVSFEGELKIIDFGLAKASLYDNKTDAGTLKGSYSYMSPEQISGKALDFRTDLFSAACVGFELFTLEKLFPSRLGLKPMFEKIAAGDISCTVNGEDCWQRIPEPVRAPLRKALSFDPAGRYPATATMLEVFEDLRISKAAGEGPPLKAWMKDFFQEKIAIQEHNRMAEKTAVAAGELSGAENPIPLGAIDRLYQPIVMTLLFLLITGAAWAGKQWYKRHQGPPLAIATIITDPPGARMSVSGQWAEGRTPLELHDLQPGRDYPLRFEASNHKPLETVLQLQGGGRQTTKFTLEREKGRILAATVPPGAEIFLNGRPTGLTTPSELTDIELFTPNKLELRLAGYRTEDVDFELEAAQLRRITVEMVPSSSRITIQSTPTGADVQADDVVIGKTPLIWNDAEPGRPYRIEIAKAGYKTHERRVTASADGAPLDLSVTLEPVRGRIAWTGAKLRGLTVNGKLAPANGADLTEGSYVYRGKFPGGQELTVRLEVSRQATGGLAGTASVNVVPYAQVDINGRSVRTTPVSDLRLGKGTNRISIAPPGGAKATLEVGLP